jgi:hypothetical protein
MPLELFCRMVAEGLLSGAWHYIQELARSTSAGRLTGRGLFPYRMIAIQTKVKEQSEQTCAVYADIGEHGTGKGIKRLMTRARI